MASNSGAYFSHLRRGASAGYSTLASGSQAAQLPKTPDAFSRDIKPVRVGGQTLTVDNWHQSGLKRLSFYHRRDPYFEFANTCDGYPIQVDGVKYLTTEHYFQGQGFKARGLEFSGENPLCGKSGDYAVAHKNYLGMKPNLAEWNAGRSIQVMKCAIHHKFNFDTHPELAMLLMETYAHGNYVLVENSPVDGYWGCGARRTGKNQLGMILMERRQQLQKDWHSKANPDRSRSDEQRRIYDLYKAKFSYYIPRPKVDPAGTLSSQPWGPQSANRHRHH